MDVLDPVVVDALEGLSPPRPVPDRWREIAAAEGGRRALLLAPLALAAAVAVVVLAWPFGGGSHGTLLERAAAALGDGPVLHVVVQDGWGGTQIDLATGARSEVHGTDEYWYDPQRGVRDVSSFAGVVQSDAFYPPSRVQYLDKTLAFLATDYRRALRSGTAKLLGSDTVDGRPVYWIRVDTQMLPDTSDGRDHEWAHDVAVAQDTLKPVATRETRDGVVGPDGISRVESIESVASANLTVTHTSPTGLHMRFEQTGSLSRAEASEVLGTPILTAGAALDGLNLSRIAKQTRTQGDATHTGVTLYYGPDSGGALGTPDPAGPFLRVSETRTLDPQFQRGVEGYSPPGGSVLVFGKTIGVMQSHGVHIALEGSSEQLLLDAARALAGA